MTSTEAPQAGPRPWRLQHGAPVNRERAWQLAVSGRGEALHPETREDMAAEWAAAMRPLAEAWQRAVRQAWEAMQPIVEAYRAQLTAAGRSVPAARGTDPATRALELRRQRNTGPQVHADPRRNR